jgi:hypothetical protein
VGSAPVSGELLAAVTGLRAVTEALLERLDQPAAPPGLGLSVGPFGTLAAVHDFNRRLSALPEVEEITIRGYEGSDRVLLDVQLAPPTA